jgi:Tfp pilus assembly protein PilZ
VLVAPRSVLGPPPPRGLPAPSIARRTGTTGAIPIALPPAPREPKKTPSGALPLGQPEPSRTGGTGNAGSIDLADLLLEELADAPEVTPALLTRLSADVSLVSEHNFFVGATRRLDSGGVFVSMPQPLPVGTAVEVRLGLPDARKVDVRGTVVFVRARGATAGRQPSGCGVKLSSVPSWAIGVAERFFVDRPPILHQP